MFSTPAVAMHYSVTIAVDLSRAPDDTTILPCPLSMPPAEIIALLRRTADQLEAQQTLPQAETPPEPARPHLSVVPPSGVTTEDIPVTPDTDSAPEEVDGTAPPTA